MVLRQAWVRLVLLLAVMLAAAGLPAARAQGVQPVPALSARVIDLAAALSASDRDALEQQLATLEQARGSQVVVLLVPTTAPEDIAAYAQRVADQWKIGRRTVGDGVLLVAAMQDRRVRIEVAKSLEGAIPDLAARQIIDRQIVPAFRTQDVAGGLRAAVAALDARIAGERLPPPTPDASWPPRTADGPAGEPSVPGLFFFLAVPMAALALTRLLGRRLGSFVVALGAGGVAGWWASSVLVGVLAGVAAWVVVGLLGVGSVLRSAGRRHGGPVILPGGFGSGSGGWGGGGGWSGGGGFSSGGGGDFGGGGASGSW